MGLLPPPISKKQDIPCNSVVQCVSIKWQGNYFLQYISQCLGLLSVIVSTPFCLAVALLGVQLEELNGFLELEVELLLPCEIGSSVVQQCLGTHYPEGISVLWLTPSASVRELGSCCWQLSLWLACHCITTALYLGCWKALWHNIHWLQL